jgi:S-adenosylmethionine synthetase
MSAKTALITGATGQLGRQCFRAFSEADGWEVIGTGFSRANPPSIRKVDLADPTQVSTLLEETRPDVVVHCAAERFPDRCSADPDAAKRLNVAASEHLARECARRRGIVLIYISTDYVFSGKPGEAPYAADAPTNPPNFYGETKLAGEEAVRAAGGRAAVLRVPVLYGEVEENKESAINVLLDTVYASGKKTEMDHWSVRYPTNTADVARVVKDIAERYVNAKEGEELPKTLQFSGEERMTKYEICQTLAEIAGLPLDHVTPNSENDPNAKG